jgi:hypothetical protein
MLDPPTATARAPPLSAAKVESIVETSFASLVALKAFDAGPHVVEKPVEPPGAFRGWTCAIAKPSAAMRAKANAKLAHLRTMNRLYIDTNTGSLHCVEVVGSRLAGHCGRDASWKLDLGTNPPSFPPLAGDLDGQF